MKVLIIFIERGFIMEDEFRQVIRKNSTSILDNMYDLVFIYDTNLRIKWMNESAESKFDMNLVEEKGNFCYKSLYDADEPCGFEICPVMQTLADGCYHEKQVKTDDELIYVVRAYPLENEEDEMIGVVEIAMDITKNIKLEEEVEYNKTKNKFFANLSHELKTPLNLIFSAVQLLNTNKDSIISKNNKNKFQRYTDIINQNSYRLLRMVNNILDITKIDSNNFKLNLKNIDIVDLIGKITESVREFIESKGRALKVNMMLDKKIIACDPSRIERVILNLLSNAVKFTEIGDQIAVSLYKGSDDNSIYISIRDTGMGIKEDKKEDIFKEFNQIGDGRGGSGMGLSIVKHLVEMHDGQVILDSEYGKGSEFIVKLPDKTICSKEVIKNRNREEQLDSIKVEFADIYK